MTTASKMRADERAMKLMAYADGELEGAELAEVETWLEHDAEAALFANDIAELGDLVKIGHPKANPAIATFDIADLVMAKIDEKPAGKVVPFQPKKRNTVGWVVAGLALAASVFFVTRSKHDDEAPMARATSPLVQPTENVAAVASGSVGIENPGKSVSVFYLPDEKSTGGSTSVSTVVWVDESGGK